VSNPHIFHVRGTREGTSGFTPFPEKTAQIGTDKRREQDIRMMKSPQHWPNPMLPMKRYDRERGRNDFAVWNGTTLTINMLLAGAFTMPVPDATPPEVLTLAPEEIAALGWTVD
jgi:hypothetical protein